MARFFKLIRKNKMYKATKITDSRPKHLWEKTANNLSVPSKDEKQIEERSHASSETAEASEFSAPASSEWSADAPQIRIPDMAAEALDTGLVKLDQAFRMLPMFYVFQLEEKNKMLNQKMHRMAGIRKPLNLMQALK